METKQRTAALVDLARLKKNVENVRRRLRPGVELMAVLKGDAYGHGIENVYPCLKACGVERYAAAVWEEGAALRRAGADEPILLLGDTWDEQLPELLRWRLTPTIFQPDTARKLNALAAQAGVVCDIHIKIDSGMNRIGFPADERALAPIAEIAALPNLRIAGAFTHYARADEPDGQAAAAQFERFMALIERLRAQGVEIPFLHTANSPAILLRPELQLDAVRAGDILYGLCPVDEERWEREGFFETMRWQSYVVMVKDIPAGAQVGYGGSFTAPRPMRIATIPVGFADGYSRALSNRGEVYIRGCAAPIVGRVCMDQFMVDVSAIDGAARGDAVELLGENMSILRMANLLDKNVDEIVCGVSKRVPRVCVGAEGQS